MCIRDRCSADQLGFKLSPVLQGISGQFLFDEFPVHLLHVPLVLYHAVSFGSVSYTHLQRSHTFTNSEGDKRITLGVYVTDGYRDTVEDGIAICLLYTSSPNPATGTG